MSLRPRPLAITVISRLAPVVVLGACATWDPDNQARDRAMAVLECEEVTMVKLADNHYRGTGCGGRIEILCSSGHLEPVCLAVRPRGDEHVSGIADLGSGGEDAEAERGDDEVARVEPAAGTPDPEAEGPSGPEADDEQPMATEPIEAHIRSGLDARRDDVLACTGRSATVVRVRYALDGSISLTLAGDLEGSPEEGCVRAALGGVRVEGGHEGVVMHLLRR